MRRQRVFDILLILIAASSYGVVTPMVKVAHQHQIPIRLLTVFQYPGPMLIFAIGWWLTHKSSAGLSRRDLNIVFWAGLAAAGTSLTYYQSLRHLPGAVAIILLFQFSWMVPMMAYAFDGKRPSIREWMAIFVIVAGTLVAAGKVHIGRASLLGLVLGFLAGVTYAATLYLSGKFRPEVSAWGRSLLSTVVGAVIIVVMYRPWAVPAASSVLGSAVAWGSAVGLFSQALPLLFIYVAAPRLGDTATGILASAELPVAVILSALWLRETVTLWQWIGVILILVGIFYGSYRSRRATTSPES